MACSSTNVPHADQIIILEAKTQNILSTEIQFLAIAHLENGFHQEVALYRTSDKVVQLTSSQ